MSPKIKNNCLKPKRGSPVLMLLRGLLGLGLEWLGVPGPVRYAIGVLLGLADQLVLRLGHVIGDIQRSAGAEAEPRSLTDAEKLLLSGIFGKGLDLAQVTVSAGPAGIFDVNNRPFVLGNRIYLKDDERAVTLVHEAVHVWQFQRWGAAYIGGALRSQWFGKGYQYRTDVERGVPWVDLEPEQQAEYVANELYLHNANDAYAQEVRRVLSTESSAG